MPPHATNKTNLSSIESAVATFKSNVGLATGDEKRSLLKLAKRLEREIASHKKTIQGV